MPIEIHFVDNRGRENAEAVIQIRTAARLWLELLIIFAINPEARPRAISSGVMENEEDGREPEIRRKRERERDRQLEEEEEEEKKKRCICAEKGGAD